MERWEMPWVVVQGGGGVRGDLMWLRSLTSFVIGSHMQLIVRILISCTFHRQRRVSTDQLHRLPA